MRDPADLALDAIESISARNSTAPTPVLSGVLSNSDAATSQHRQSLRDPVLVGDQMPACAATGGTRRGPWTFGHAFERLDLDSLQGPD